MAKAKNANPGKQKRGSRKSRKPKKASAKVAKPNRSTGRVFNNSSVVRGAAQQRAAIAKQSGTAALCAITDPFCKHAVGAKLPDGSPGNSLTSSARGFVTMVTSASAGYSGFWFNPNNAGYSTYTSTTASNTQALGAAWASVAGLSMLQSYGKACRIVSCGIVLRAAQTATTAQGQFTIVEGPSFPLSAAYDVNDLTYSKVQVVSNYSGMVHTIKLSPNNSVLATQFIDLQNSTGYSSAIGWPSIFIGYSGGATGTANLANVEYFVHYEWIPLSSTDVAVLAGPTAKSSPMLMDAKSRIDTAHAGGTTASPESVSAVIKTGVEQAKGIAAVAKDVWDAGSEVVNLAETWWASL